MREEEGEKRRGCGCWGIRDSLGIQYGTGTVPPKKPRDEKPNSNTGAPARPCAWLRMSRGGGGASSPNEEIEAVMDASLAAWFDDYGWVGGVAVKAVIV